MDPTLWLERVPLALGVNVVLGALAWRGGTVRASGFAAGVFLGTVIFTCLGWQGFLLLVVFFAVGSGLTRFGYARKVRLGAAEASGGARGASNAFAKTGLPAAFAVGAGLTGHPVWTLLFTTSLATATMDTTASEIGPLAGRRTVSLRNGRRVPPGTQGAISLEGTVAGLLGAGALGGAAAMLEVLAWPQLAWVILGAFVGNLVEGILGARHLLPHEWLNVVNLLTGAATAALLATLLG